MNQIFDSEATVGNAMVSHLKSNLNFFIETVEATKTKMKGNININIE